MWQGHGVLNTETAWHVVPATGGLYTAAATAPSPPALLRPAPAAAATSSLPAAGWSPVAWPPSAAAASSAAACSPAAGSAAAVCSAAAVGFFFFLAAAFAAASAAHACSSLCLALVGQQERGTARVVLDGGWVGAGRLLWLAAVHNVRSTCCPLHNHHCASIKKPAPQASLPGIVQRLLLPPPGINVEPQLLRRRAGLEAGVGGAGGWAVVTGGPC